MTRYQRFQNNLAWGTLGAVLWMVAGLARAALYEDEAKTIDMIRDGVKEMKIRGPFNG
jgi:hypothetical protein